jgi:hypothetical protein
VKRAVPRSAAEQTFGSRRAYRPSKTTVVCAKERHGLMIIFRCPNTGLDVQTSILREENPEARSYEAVLCSACTRLHFIDTTTGKVVGVQMK